MKLTNQNYRPEIDLLRCIAVGGVILYHFGVGVSGGFIGVDIFFVISGYLIGKMVITDIQNGNFKLTNFYTARIKRIIPALVFMLAVLTITLHFILYPPYLETYAKSVVSALLFYSNFYFWSQTGYFEITSGFSPLLHTWSLAVEEQFYLLFPIFAIVFIKCLPKHFWKIAFAFLILSFALSVGASVFSPSANFYFLPTRSWELILGVLCNHPSVCDKSTVISDRFFKWSRIFSLPSVLLLIIIFSMLIFDKTMYHPGLITIIPTLSTAVFLVITSKKSAIPKLIQNKYLVFLGLISYSLYLWHQPIGFLFVYFYPNLIGNFAMVLKCILTVGISCISYYLIENYFRYRSLAAYIFTSALTFAMLIYGTVAINTKGFLSHYTDEQQTMLNYETTYRLRVRNDATQYASSCNLQPDETFENLSENCLMQNSDILIWGDSHARALAQGYSVLKDTTAVYSSASASACPPIMNYEPDDRANCKGFNDDVLDALVRIKPKKVLLHANWQSYQGIYGEVRNDDAFIDLLTNSLFHLSNALPNTQLILVAGVPQWKPSLPVRIVEAGLPLDHGQLVEVRDYERLEKVNGVLKSSVMKIPGIIVFDPLEHLCQNKSCLALLEGASGEIKPFAWDYGHITEEGAEYMLRLLLEE